MKHNIPGMRVRYRTAIWLLVMLSFSHRLYGQNSLYVHSNNDLGLYLVNLDNCSSKLIGYLPGRMYDIALSPDGQLYGVSPSFELFELDKNTARGVAIIKTKSVMNALVAGPDKFLYGADGGGRIFKIDPKARTIVDLGYCGYGSGGDLTFYEGELYLASTSNELIKINLKDPSKSSTLGSLKTPNILGIITVGSTDCQGTKPRMYATADNKIYTVDLTARGPVVTFTCSLTVYAIGGAASLAEASLRLKKNAGRDSAVTVCFHQSAAVNLPQYLPGIETGGQWTDLDKAGVLTGSTLNSQSLNAGVYRFRYVLGEGVCTDTSIVSVSVKRTAITEINLKRPGCLSDNGEIEIVLPAGSPGSQYSVNGRSYQANNRFTGLKADSYTLRVRTPDGCEADTTVTLTSADAPQISGITARNARCGLDNGEITALAAGGTGSLVYSLDGLAYQSQPTFSNLAAGRYRLLVKDAAGCSSPKEVSLSQSRSPAIRAADGLPTSCGQANGRINAAADGGLAPLRFSIDSVHFQPAGVFLALQSGTYRLVVMDSAGCVAGKTVTVDPSTAVIITSVRHTAVECGEKNGEIVVVATGTEPLRYSLQTGQTQNQPTFDNVDSGTYQLAVYDATGCSVHQQVVVEDNCRKIIYLPTAFTPNNDQVNDTWVVRFQQKKVSVLQLSIFNRWGELIYARQNFDLRSGDSLWDGLTDGKKVSDNVFAYVLELQFADNKTHVYRGPLYRLD